MDLTKYTKLARKALKLRNCGAVIVAAGSASRMGGIDKVMAPLKGEPMIVHTVRAFESCDAVKEIVIVTREDLIAPIMELCKDFPKVKAVVMGGRNRSGRALALCRNRWSWQPFRTVPVRWSAGSSSTGWFGPATAMPLPFLRLL